MYAWSFNPESERFYGIFKTFNEAVEDAREQVKEEYRCGKSITVYVGEIEKYCPSPTCFDVIERISDDCYDEACCDCYLTDVSEKEEDELEDMLLRTFLKWAKKHGYEPSKVWYVPINTIREVILGEEKQ